MDRLDVIFRTAADDRDRGATEIEARLVRELLGQRELWDAGQLKRSAVRLVEAQSAMANLRNLARCLSSGTLDEIEARVRRRADLLSEMDGRLGAATWPHLKGADRVVTISRSSAVRAALDEAWRRGWCGEVVVFDGSSAGRGADQARLLATRSDRVLSQPDALIPKWLGGRNVRVLTGADAVSRRRLINVCGTGVLLELAAARSVPVFVVADTGKDLPDAELDELLAAAPSAVGEGPNRRWPIFETVSLEPIIGRIHE